MCSVIQWVLVLGLTTLRRANIFPADVEVCNANDPDINKCFMESANKLIPRLAKGMENIGLIPLDPVFVKWMGLPKGNKELPTLGFNLTNQNHYGLKDARVIDSRIQPKDYKLEFKLFIPSYTFIGTYQSTGSVILIDLEGYGDMEVTLVNSTLNVIIEGEPVPRNGDNYLMIKNLKFGTTIVDGTFKLGNLFNNKYISDSINVLMNLNSKALVTAGGNAVSAIFTEFYKTVLQKMFDTVPYNQLFAGL